MNERISTQWSNKTRERIENPEKAEYMARVEDLWRTSIANLVRVATEAPIVGEDAWGAAQYQALVFGPASVEAAGKAWDEFHNPVFPPTIDESMRDGAYATGNRQFLE